MVLKLYLLFAIVLQGSILNAAEVPLTPDSECKEERLDYPPEPVSKVPVFDMDGLNMCSSYMVSCIANAEKAIKEPSNFEPISPLYLGVKYATSKNQPTLEISNAMDLAKNYKSMPACSYKAVGDFFNGEQNGEFLRKLLKSYNTKDPESLKCLLREKFPSSLNRFKEFNSYYNSSTYVAFASEIFDDICRANPVNTTSLPDIKIKKAYEYRDRTTAMIELRKLINKNLSTSRPTGIGFCPLVLRNPDHTGVDSRGFMTKSTCHLDGPNGEQLMAGHTSTVVGRRLFKFKKENGDTGTICQYLVRDVYGASCAPYKNNKDVCENGQVWVDENALLDNVAEIYSTQL